MCFRRWSRSAPFGLFVLAALLFACSAPAAPAAPAGAAAGAAKPAAAVADAAAKPAAASPSPAAAAPAFEPRSLQVGGIALVGYFYPVWAALELGLFRELGVNVDWTTFAVNEAMAALTSGNLDILQSSTDLSLNAVSKGAGIKLVADYTLQAPYDLMARTDIASVEALRGQKVGASSLRSGSGTIVRVML